MMYHIKAEADGIPGIQIQRKILLHVKVLNMGIIICFAAITFKTNIKVIIAINERSVGKYLLVNTLFHLKVPVELPHLLPNVLDTPSTS